MQLVILAAGMGTRLGKPDHPKSLVTIKDDDSYLSLQFRSFRTFPFSKIILVGGYGFDHLKEFVDGQGLSNTVLLNNTDFQKGNLYSILTAKSELTEDFFIFNADHYYPIETYQKIMATKGDLLTAFCDRDRKLTDDDMKLQSKDGYLIEMKKTLSTFDCGYVGVTYVPSREHGNYWNACDAVSQELGDKANVEAVLNQMAANGQKIQIADISGSWWTEIDTPEDLIKAREIILKYVSPLLC